MLFWLLAVKGGRFPKGLAGLVDAARPEVSWKYSEVGCKNCRALPGLLASCSYQNERGPARVRLKWGASGGRLFRSLPPRRIPNPPRGFSRRDGQLSTASVACRVAVIRFSHFKSKARTRRGRARARRTRAAPRHSPFPSRRACGGSAGGPGATALLTPRRPPRSAPRPAAFAETGQRPPPALPHPLRSPRA